ncbi:hypothetical protein D3C84_1119270 [compost metagenome]
MKPGLLLQPMPVHLQITFTRLSHRIVVQQTGYGQCLDIVERNNVQYRPRCTSHGIRSVKRRGKGHFAGGYQ